jgi:hypothetical protein
MEPKLCRIGAMIICRWTALMFLCSLVPVCGPNKTGCRILQVVGISLVSVVLYGIKFTFANNKYR